MRRVCSLRKTPLFHTLLLPLRPLYSRTFLHVRSPTTVPVTWVKKVERGTRARARNREWRGPLEKRRRAHLSLCTPHCTAVVVLNVIPLPSSSLVGGRPREQFLRPAAFLYRRGSRHRAARLSWWLIPSCASSWFTPSSLFLPPPSSCVCCCPVLTNAAFTISGSLPFRASTRFQRNRRLAWFFYASKRRRDLLRHPTQL